VGKNNSKEYIESEEQLQVWGAKAHNLKNIDVTIPRNQLTVITGLSGSGKSSLAFDTIYAEGQRRYIETFSAYARQFLGNMDRPEVDKITGLSPVISIEQKTTNKNPRSTVGTVTEIYDFLRLLFARAADAYSHVSGKKMVKYTDEQIADIVLEKLAGKKIYVLAPLVKGRKGHYKELFEQLIKKGFVHARINGEVKELTSGMRLDRYKTHYIETVVDRLAVKDDSAKRLRESLQLAMKNGEGVTMIMEADTGEVHFFSQHLMCPESGISYNEPAPHTFSFNSPVGACPKCKGLGYVHEIDMDKVIPDKKLSLKKGAIVPLGKQKNSLIWWQIEALADKYKFTLNTAVNRIPEEALDTILFGSDEPLKLQNTPMGNASNYYLSFPGVVSYLQSEQGDEVSTKSNGRIQHYVTQIDCPECNGARLRKESLHFKIAEKNIAELSLMDMDELYQWLQNIEGKLSEKQKKIAVEILKELRDRVGFLMQVGLNYLSLNRSAKTLSGGESQRIRLATQIGSQLVNVLYILDEPSIGLHQRDNQKLIGSLKELRDTGNSVIVVEHDKDMILAADHVLDIGPKAGRHGGRVCAEGTPEEFMHLCSLTSDYLTGKKKIELPEERRNGKGKNIVLKGCTGHNLKNVNVNIPLGKLICVTGVSGSGKSSLINGTLHPILNKHFYRALQTPLPYKSITGIDHVDKVIEVNQSPLGRTPRSNPATYTGVFSDIRNLFVRLPEAQIRGYKAGRFSFNVKGGRCETCKGAGIQTIEMNFLPDVNVPCNECHGKRYNRETLEVRYKGKSISDVLDMTINQAVEFFENIPSIIRKIKSLQEVGLGYITLGQPSTTLSGGESQRVKLAAELAKKDTGKTLYILDEPTTGLHFEDIRVLMKVIDKLVDKGNTMIIIEHNMDVIKMADHIIDIGPEGGTGGGNILFEGTPEELVKANVGYTAGFLKEELKN
jgi:excinuclease ABC subunit A